MKAPSPEFKFALGDRVTKIKGSLWTGRVVGFYSTDLTPIGYCVESETERGSVQIYPEVALQAATEARANEGVLVKALEALDAYRFYIDAANDELQERGITRAEALALARELDPYDGLTPVSRQALAPAPVAEDMVPVPRYPTEAMLAAGHRQIDWCRNGQNTGVNEHPSQTEVIGGVACGTTCKQDLQDAWAAMLAAAEQEASRG